jgi:hypothetical protein
VLRLWEHESLGEAIGAVERALEATD